MYGYGKFLCKQLFEKGIIVYRNEKGRLDRGFFRPYLVAQFLRAYWLHLFSIGWDFSHSIAAIPFGF